jgi:Spy/CpxP family protein refolding chaperone
MTPRAQTRLKIWLVVLSIFILGGVTGAALDSIYRLKANGGRGAGGADARGPRDTGKTLEKMKSDLSLTDQQAEQIRSILDQTRNDYRALRNEVRPRYDALRQQARAKIRALLNPDQQQKFDAKVAEHDARRNENNDH